MNESGSYQWWRAAPRIVAATAGFYVMLGGVITLIGWASGVYWMTDWAAYGVSMKANPAVASLAAGAALILLSIRPSFKLGIRVLAAVSGSIGALTLFEHLSDVDMGIDTLLFDEPAGALGTSSPQRMGPPASTSFTLAGTALILLTRGAGSRRLASVLAGIVCFISGLSLTGYVFGANQLYAVPRLTGISLQAASILFVLAIGIWAALPEYGVVTALRRNDAGGMLARRLLIPVVLLPLAIGWLEGSGIAAGLFDPAFGTATFAFLMIVVLTWLVMATASKVSDSAAELRAADRRKDDFLATLAHELRNPLAPLRNALEIMHVAPGNTTVVASARATMDRQVRHMVRLIDDLLDVSRISRDKLTLHEERLELGAILEDAIETCRPELEAGRYDFRISMPDEPVVLAGDPVRLTQAFGNLLNNACKYTEAGGRIALSVLRNEGYVLVSVSDNGIGIAPEMLSGIFEMFAQLDRSLERSRGGLGIGLSLARRIIELHGGTIVARSKGEGHGSEFLVKLPTQVTQELRLVNYGA